MLQAAGVASSEINDLYFETRSFPSALLIYYRPYHTADGLIAVACLSEPLRKRMGECVGFEDRRFEPGYDLEAPESIEFADHLLEKVEGLIAEKSSEDWLRIFHEAGVPAMPVQYVDGLLDNEQAIANGLVRGLSDRMWTEATGKRTPLQGLGTFWDEQSRGGSKVDIDDLL